MLSSSKKVNQLYFYYVYKTIFIYSLFLYNIITVNKIGLMLMSKASIIFFDLFQKKKKKKDKDCPLLFYFYSYKRAI